MVQYNRCYGMKTFLIMGEKADMFWEVCDYGIKWNESVQQQ